MDGITNLIKYIGCWVAIWPRGGSSRICCLSLTDQDSGDGGLVYADIVIGVGKSNGGKSYIIKAPLRMGGALNHIIDEYNKKTSSRKTPVFFPPELEDELERRCVQNKFQWMSFAKNRGLVMGRILIGDEVRRVYAESFIEALTLALGLGETTKEIPATGATGQMTAETLTLR